MKNLSRRFGHAATDRQIAYLSQGEIDAAASRNDMLGRLSRVFPLSAPFMVLIQFDFTTTFVEFCKTAVASKAITWTEIDEEFQSIQAATERAFNAAVNEPKILERQPLLDSLSAPEARGARGTAVEGADWSYSNRREHKAAKGATATKVAAEVMRKHMTTVFDEALGGHSPAGQHAIYLGEDVRHGG